MSDSNSQAPKYTVVAYPHSYGFAVVDESNPGGGPVFAHIDRRFCEWAAADRNERGIAFPAWTEPKFERVLEIVEGGKRMFFSVPTYSDLLKAALTVVQDRITSGYWGDSPELPTEPALSREEVQKLPPGKLREGGIAEWQEYDVAAAAHDAESPIREGMRKAGEDNDAAAALFVLVEASKYAGFGGQPADDRWEIHTISQVIE